MPQSSNVQRLLHAQNNYAGNSIINFRKVSGDIKFMKILNPRPRSTVNLQYFPQHCVHSAHTDVHVYVHVILYVLQCTCICAAILQNQNVLCTCICVCVNINNLIASLKLMQFQQMIFDQVQRLTLTLNFSTVHVICCRQYIK